MDYIDWLKQYCPKKEVSPRRAVSAIKSGNRVFIGTGWGEPQHLVRTMANDLALQDVLIYQMLPGTLCDYLDDKSFLYRFSLKLFFTNDAMQKAVYKGNIDYVPACLSQIPELFAGKHIGLDAALIQVSPPDQSGYCSLGVSVDITRAAVKNSKLVIAQVNPRMPMTSRDSSVHVDDIDYLVIHEEPLEEFMPATADEETARRIGHYVSQLVNDGAALQIGPGHLPYAISKYLDTRRDLGPHAQVITDAFLPSFGSEYVSDPTAIARNDNVISISSAWEVDLTGQVCSDSPGYLFYSGIGDQVDFMRAGSMSKGGFSIVALPAIARKGEASRIVSHLSEGAGVAATRCDVDFVVTEYGIAQLKGKSSYQRVIELAQIAHPKFRSGLIENARQHHDIFSDQLLLKQEDLFFLENYRSFFRLKSGKAIELRPVLASDELEFRNFHYSLSEQTIYQRFFRAQTVFPRHFIQEQWAKMDYRRNMAIIGLTSTGGHKEIMASASYTEVEQGRAEIAFVVRDDFQGQGIGLYLLDILEKIARENGYTGFTATVLSENKKMIRIFRKLYPNCKITSKGIDTYFEMDFAPEG